MKKTTLTLIAAVAVMLSACDKSNNDYSLVEVILNQTQLDYDENGLWTGATDGNATVISQGIAFSHSAYDGAWTSGFVASRNSDTGDYTSANWPYWIDWREHLFTAITGGGKSGTRTPYLVAYWDARNEDSVINITEVTDASCYFMRADQAEFTPVSMLVCNTTYTYYTMMHGMIMAKKFANGDWLKLNAYGITANGKTTGPVEFYLADYRSGNAMLITDWAYVNLESLGQVKGVYFTMDSSDKDKLTNKIYTPSYFAIDRVVVDTKQ